MLDLKSSTPDYLPRTGPLSNFSMLFTETAKRNQSRINFCSHALVPFAKALRMSYNRISTVLSVSDHATTAAPAPAAAAATCSGFL
ncbi:hypothetical protein E2C01_055091 [Portunus trituberculatus]|uniref:Uncharacterized protein n=1 Tax=Portunus trituberculatus TaxID=210409 RepID=A0A5B7GVN7_PORTR|nr:hypothetical protein [Portunus trituberculatus]